MKYHNYRITKKGMAIILAAMLMLAGCGNANTGNSTPSGDSTVTNTPGNNDTTLPGEPSGVWTENGQTDGTGETDETGETEVLGTFEQMTDADGNVINTEFAEIASIEDVFSGTKTEIVFSGNSAKISGAGCSMKDGVLTIEDEGTYVVSGTLDDGYICVDAKKKNVVNLVLNGVEIANDDGAAIFVKKSQKTNIYLAERTTNILTDGSNYVYESADETEPNAALYSKSDLTLSGKGTLIVYANYNDGITGKDSLALLGGNIQITSAGDGIVGKDYLYITGGNYQMVTGGGVKNAETHFSGMDRGFFGGGGASSTAETDSSSKKALKSEMLIQVDGGTFDIDSCDDVIHSDDAVVINGGSFVISCGDDAIHAETELFINGGVLDIVQSYEGMEALDITINGGEISIVASDDGINAAGTASTETQDNSQQGFFGGRGGMGGFGMMEDTGATLTVNAGYLRINAAGDGLDANGGIAVTGGEIYVDGPVNSGNGSLDYATTCVVDGGILVAAGSIGMSQATSTTSSQPAISYSVQNQPAGTVVSVKDASGNILVSYTSAKNFQNIVISAPGMVVGETYSISVGDTVTELELTSMVNYVGSSGGFGGMGVPNGQGGGMGVPEAPGGGFGGGSGGRGGRLREKK